MMVEKRYSDADLLAAIRNKSTLDSAIRSIYLNYAETISSLILKTSGTRQDAEDVLQETVVSFIEMVKKNRFRQESSIKTFLVAIARNIWLNELKRRERSGFREEVFETSRAEQEPDVSDIIAEREVKQAFRNVLSLLGDKCHRLLTLYYYENLSMKEILAHLPYDNEQVVRNKKYKCLQQLTGMLKDNPLIAKLIKEKF